MPIAFRCQQCGESYNGADTLAGKKIKCRKCSAVVTVPSPQAAKPATKPARPAPAAPAVDLLTAPLPAVRPLSGQPYTLQGSPTVKGQKRPPARPQRGPGVIQSAIMIGGTVGALVLFAGAYGVFSRMTAHIKPVAAPKTGMEAAGGLRQAPLNPSGMEADPDFD